MSEHKNKMETLSIIIRNQMKKIHDQINQKYTSQSLFDAKEIEETQKIMTDTRRTLNKS